MHRLLTITITNHSKARRTAPLIAMIFCVNPPIETQYNFIGHGPALSMRGAHGRSMSMNTLAPTNPYPHRSSTKLRIQRITALSTTLSRVIDTINGQKQDRWSGTEGSDVPQMDISTCNTTYCMASATACSARKKPVLRRATVPWLPRQQPKHKPTVDNVLVVDCPLAVPACVLLDMSARPATLYGPSVQWAPDPAKAHPLISSPFSPPHVSPLPLRPCAPPHRARTPAPHRGNSQRGGRGGFDAVLRVRSWTLAWALRLRVGVCENSVGSSASSGVEEERVRGLWAQKSATAVN
ncbi:hypothetical protein B0H10DRAFT_2314620 [Mycena sp. CBHHK59/15]|nr:hypothetical protein B0H10DRAFT_2314620 [Mycena sp. CBHHK59/15]